MQSEVMLAFFVRDYEKISCENVYLYGEDPDQNLLSRKTTEFFDVVVVRRNNAVNML